MSFPPETTILHGRRRRRFAYARFLAPLILVGGCGLAVSWDAGLFTSDGRFAALDACTLMPPPQPLAPLVSHGAREPGDSRPKNWLGGHSGDVSSQCKWSSVPAGQDRPFRTVRIRVQTWIREGHVSAETRATRDQAQSREPAARSHRTPATPVGVGEQGYTYVDDSSIQIPLLETNIYDIHVKFRVSNAVVDVSARTHSRPGPKETALVLGLAEDVARRMS
ncbi:hypothetical protein [Actinoallomurus sp. NPDC050550]|uniref:hypothetical protein n=1 Tax=Actinoallomurus sp. NPDC050550 TaxID=3154937 RepID=UPI0033D9B9C7